MSFSKTDLYDIADHFGLPMILKDDRVTGEKRHYVIFGDVRLSVPLKVITAKSISGHTLLACRSIGNIILVAVTNFSKAKSLFVFVVDAAKYKGEPTKMFDTMVYLSEADDVVRILSSAIVGTFYKQDKDIWAKIK